MALPLVPIIAGSAARFAARRGLMGAAKALMKHSARKVPSTVRVQGQAKPVRVINNTGTRVQSRPKLQRPVRTRFKHFLD